ncbi:FAD-binding protein [Crossiella cryophila]|uniref:3-oxo-5alpha-steroid 4-dehydrogenase n=1 Tax=Crossiella cryophila TaxID=43355 RepID=A0A7W7CHG4_9PSEU|nr:FAD-binding protein [Crossiella cryophila]MBB4681047.1 3-oxo-5alpha-steroid 4-dehydrogenase [Crossiella cryophila]
MSTAWDDRAEVVVLGFGAAGACAAIEAAAGGADVLVVDRFSGGGTTAISGGVVYAGGGTKIQSAAGVGDSVEAMHAYLREEVGDAVSPETLRRFCATSADHLEWLRRQGVPFEGSLCPYKTSYPDNRYYLYFSGSENSGAFRRYAVPAPRGHRAKGPGTSGATLFTALAESVRCQGARVRTQTTARRLIVERGRVTGVECRSLDRAPGWVRLAHRVLSRYAAKPGVYLPWLRRLLHGRVAGLERRHGRRIRIGATTGVIIAAGGFAENREMLREHAPDHRGGLALGTPGDDGSGIRLGVEAGAATALLDRVSAWRFLSPPSALLSGLLVDRDGARVIDESRYGAAVGEALISRHRGRGWLLVDAAILAEARRQVPRQALWFQRVQAYAQLAARVTGPTLESVAARAGVDPAGLRATVRAHQDRVRRRAADPTGRPAELSRELRPPFALLDMSIRNRLNPCPMLPLGGLVVDERTGAVRRPDGSAIPGLYAAGRSAVGLCSRSYVSGLSLADCVFSGRRAGAHLAATRRSGAHR